MNHSLCINAVFIFLKDEKLLYIVFFLFFWLFIFFFCVSEVWGNIDGIVSVELIVAQSD